MKAVLIKDEYSDLVPDYPYKVTKVFALKHIMLEGSPRRYDASSFELYHNDEKITYAEAYRVYKMESAMKKVGMK